MATAPAPSHFQGGAPAMSSHPACQFQRRRRGRDGDQQRDGKQSVVVSFQIRAHGVPLPSAQTRAGTHPMHIGKNGGSTNRH